MNIVLSLFSTKKVSDINRSGPDLLEIRLDQWKDDPVPFIRDDLANSELPLIVTIRSEQEGGFFHGTPDKWAEIVRPMLPYADYVDIERNFRKYSHEIRSSGKKVIASCHTSTMLHTEELVQLEADLRSYGDIPKIIVTPGSHEDVLELAYYLLNSTLPICLGVMGVEFRYARALLALYGSFFVYCHGGSETAKGQYNVHEMKEILKLLNSGDLGLDNH